jgi:hypothetical protein
MDDDQEDADTAENGKAEVSPSLPPSKKTQREFKLIQTTQRTQNSKQHLLDSRLKEINDKIAFLSSAAVTNAPKIAPLLAQRKTIRGCVKALVAVWSG